MMHVDKGNTKTTIQTESDKVGVTDLLLRCSRALYSGVFVNVAQTEGQRIVPDVGTAYNYMQK